MTSAINTLKEKQTTLLWRFTGYCKSDRRTYSFAGRIKKYEYSFLLNRKLDVLSSNVTTSQLCMYQLQSVNLYLRLQVKRNHNLAPTYTTLKRKKNTITTQVFCFLRLFYFQTCNTAHYTLAIRSQYFRARMRIKSPLLSIWMLYGASWKGWTVLRGRIWVPMDSGRLCWHNLMGTVVFWDENDCIFESFNNEYRDTVYKVKKRRS